MGALPSGLEHALEEQQRVSLLAELGVLDTAPEPGFDALTQAAAALTGCPIALVSLVDGERNWFKSHHGIDIDQAPRKWSFCAAAILAPGLLQVRDATADPRFAHNPLVCGEPGVRFYAGQPLTVDGVRIGTLCVADTRSRELSAVAQEALRGLGVAAAAMLGERRSRAASLEQQRRLTEFAMVSGDWLWETDAEHRVVWMSCAYATDPARPEPWVLGRPMADAAVLDAVDEAVMPPITLHQLFDQRHAFARAAVQCEAAGARYYLSLSAVCRRDASGRWCGYRGIARDMSARVAAEQGRRDAAALLAELSAQVPGLIFQLRRDPQGRLSFPYVSERVHDLYELSAAQLMCDATAALQRCHPQDLERVTTSLERSAVQLGIWRETFRVVLPSGGERVLSGCAKPKRLADGSVLWHGLLSDVTEQARETEKLQEMSLAQVAAEKAAQVRSEFLSRVSHELRTPLNAVLGFAQLLRRNGANQSGEEMLKSAAQIENAGAHLLSLINAMLDLSSLEAGHLHLQLRPVAVARLVQRCVAMVEPHARQSDITLAIRIDPLLPTVLADARAVKQVIFNLVGNAIKFARPHTVVHLRARHEPLEALVALSISDQGPGIDPDNLASIFEPFTRLHRSGGAPVGSGLGLSISQKLVLAMGGRIDVDSRVGQGTTFTVRLPVDGRPEAAAPADSGFGGVDDFVATGSIGGATVLYIEDEPVNALLMEAFFGSLPATAARLVIAATASEGLRVAFRLRPDLVLLDMNLPDLDGLSVLARLRADPRTAHIPVIAVSADALPEQVRIARDAGCDDYWTKPIDFKRVHADLARRFPIDR
jgi:signal transduction histidine kinase/GAF domain-containing protein